MTIKWDVTTMTKVFLFITKERCKIKNPTLSDASFSPLQPIVWCGC